MSSLFKTPTIIPPPPTPVPPPPMPDPFSPAAAEAAKIAAATRAGRSSTMLTRQSQGAGAPGTIAGGATAPYSGATLGGAR